MIRFLNLSTGGSAALSQLPVIASLENQNTYHIYAGASQGAINALGCAARSASVMQAFYANAALDRNEFLKRNSIFSILFGWSNGFYSWGDTADVLFKLLGGRKLKAEVWIKCWDELEMREVNYKFSKGESVSAEMIDIALSSASPMGLMQSHVKENPLSDPGFRSMIFTDEILNLHSVRDIQLTIIAARSGTFPTMKMVDWLKMDGLERTKRGLKTMLTTPLVKDIKYLVDEMRDMGNKNPIALYQCFEQLESFSYSTTDAMAALNAGKKIKGQTL